MNANNAWLKQRAVDAVNFSFNYVNATLYFQTLNGWVNSNSTSTSTTTSNTLTTFLKQISNTATAIFSNTATWIQSVFSNYNSAINPCFQAWANITNGAYCVLSSSSSVGYVNNTNNAVTPLSFIADPTSTGNALAACAPLIETYCSLTYGLSVNQAAHPFNKTFNWSDGGMSINDCYNFRNQTNCTTCAGTLNSLYTTLFQTNWIKFIPSTANIASLGAFLTSPVSANNTFTPIAQSSNGVSIGLSVASGSTGENLVVAGQQSGQPKQTYSASLILANLLSLAMFLMA
jgi:hypothetical protein